MAFFTDIINNLKESLGRTGTGLKTVSEGLSPFYSDTGVGDKAIKFVKEALIEYPARFGASTTLQPEQTFQPKGFFSEFLLGKEPITSLTKQVAEATTGLEQAGFGKTSLPIATTAILGGGLLDFTGAGGSKKVGQKIIKETAPDIMSKVSKFEGFKDLTTKFLDYAKGKTQLSKQEILDFARRPELKKGEADLLNRLGSEIKETKIPAQDFADSIRRDLLELKPVKIGEVGKYTKELEKKGYKVDFDMGGDEAIIIDKKGNYVEYNDVPKDIQNLLDGVQNEIARNEYSGVTIDRTMGNKVGKNYEEVIFESPIRTDGSSHFPNSKNYFAHARGDEVVEGGKKIWREQEIQSDLLQKDNLEKLKKFAQRPKIIYPTREFTPIEEINKLDPFTNDRFGERIMRERIKEKASKGYSKYRLPTGETIGKIEGFNQLQWGRSDTGIKELIEPKDLRVGMQVSNDNINDWIITDILGDGRFKAVPKSTIDLGEDVLSKMGYKYPDDAIKAIGKDKRLNDFLAMNKETFDLTGKSNPQYKRYEQWGKFLKSKFGGKEIVDKQGNKWVEVDLSGAMAKAPVEAFGVVAGVETDEEGNVKFDPTKAALGVAGMGAIKKVGGKEALERGFITSAKEAIPEAKRIAGQYIPRSTDQLAIKAKNLIKTDINTAENLALRGINDDAVATASELLKHYSEEAEKATSQSVKNALYDKAAEVANTIAPKLTEQGRSIQAASILGRLTPEGQVKFAASQIAKYNEKVSLAKKIPGLTGEQAKYIETEMKAINQMAEGVEKGARFQKLQDYITKLVPTPLVKKVIAVWKAGLLTGLKTSGLNIFANLSHATTETIKDIPATIADKALSLFSGKRTMAFNTQGLLEGVKEGLGKGWQYLKTGFDERNIAAKLDYTKVNFGKGKIAQGLQAYTDTIFRLMGTEDQPFYYASKMRSLYGQAKAEAINKGLKGDKAKKFIENLIQNPTDQMIKYASIDAETAVFQNETALARIASSMTKAVPTTEVIIPFRRTPSAVAMQILNYTPTGIAKEVFQQIVRKDFNQKLLSQAIGRGLTGSAALGLGGYLATKDLITTSYPTNEKERELWKLEGRQPNSIKVGGKWREAQVLGPVGNVLLVGASFQKAFEDTGTISGATSQGLADASKAFTQQTFLIGVSNFLDALSDPPRLAPYVGSSLVGSTIPTLVGDVARATDTKERRTEAIFDRLVSRIPMLRQTLEPQISVLGEERDIRGNPLEIMIDPTRPSPAETTSLISELRRLWNSGYKVSPTLLGDKKGYKVLTPEQNTELWKRAGEITNEKTSKLIELDSYKKADDEQKSKKIESFVSQSKINARAEMAVKLTERLQGEELKSKLSELKAGGLLTKDVYKKYLEIR